MNRHQLAAYGSQLALHGGNSALWVSLSQLLNVGVCYIKGCVFITSHCSSGLRYEFTVILCDVGSSWWTVFGRATRAFQNLLYLYPDFKRCNEVHVRLGLMFKAASEHESSLKVISGWCFLIIQIVNKYNFWDLYSCNGIYLIFML